MKLRNLSQLIVSEQDNQYMLRALELASRGMGKVAPNPMVGCVIVQEGKIVGEGWHQNYGESHAEANAINSVSDESLLEGATVYVNLEPCSYFGKTPPCANLLADLPIKRVVFSHIDPNPRVRGKGKEILIGKGIEVSTGVLQEKAEHLNRRFIINHSKNRPYIILKWAQTKDGFLARTNFDSKWISNKYSRTMVHKWRSEEAAIMVGKNTVLHDKPDLTVRDWTGKNPIRIIIDHKSAIPNTNKLLQDKKTLVYYTGNSDNKAEAEYQCLPQDNFMDEMLKDLKHRGIQSVLVEGGAKLLSDFINCGLWDEARVFISNIEFKEGIEAPNPGIESDFSETVMGDSLFYYSNNKNG